MSSLINNKLITKTEQADKETNGLCGLNIYVMFMTYRYKVKGDHVTLNNRI